MTPTTPLTPDTMPSRVELLRTFWKGAQGVTIDDQGRMVADAECAACGETFSRSVSHGGWHRYCSGACQQRAHYHRTKAAA